MLIFFQYCVLFHLLLAFNGYQRYRLIKSATVPARKKEFSLLRRGYFKTMM